MGLSLNRSPIVVLLFSRSPTAVAWLVIAVIVDAVKGSTTRAWSHVLKKLSEIVLPLWADRNTSSTVVFVRRKRPVSATGSHGVPRVVFARHGGLIAHGGSVRGRSTRCVFGAQTTTTSRHSIPNMRPSLDGNFAAITAHDIHRQFRSAGRQVTGSALQNNKPAESFPDVVGSWHVRHFSA